MASNLTELVISGRTFPNVLALPKSTKIGDLEVEASLGDEYVDQIEMTENPLEVGTATTDHAFKRQPEFTLECGWSNSSLKALRGIVTGFFLGGTMSNADYVAGVYSQLLKMQESLEPLSVTTGLRHYDNCLIKTLSVSRDPKSSQILMVRAVFRALKFVSTRSAALPPKENQAFPAVTAETLKSGAKQLIPAFPAPGGAVPPNEW